VNTPDTLEIGTESVGGRCPPLHVRSTWLDIESRVEGVGEAPGGVYHARSFASCRRVLIAGGLDGESGQTILDLMEELPALAADQTLAAVIESLARRARLRRLGVAPFDCWVFQISRRKLDWAGIGRGVLAFTKRRTFPWRPAAPEIATCRSEEPSRIVGGSLRLAPGDRLIAFSGAELAEGSAAAILAEALEGRAALARELGARGILAAIERPAKQKEVG
jgi:hypothetical protein